MFHVEHPSHCQSHRTKRYPSMFHVEHHELSLVEAKLVKCSTWNIQRCDRKSHTASRNCSLWNIAAGRSHELHR